MRCFIGIDLGSTTTKSVVIDEHRNILGRGITNSRSNYDTAATIAKQEALVNARFHLFREGLSKTGGLNGGLETFLGQLERDLRLEQFLEQLAERLPLRGLRCGGIGKACLELGGLGREVGDAARQRGGIFIGFLPRGQQRVAFSL